MFVQVNRNQSVFDETGRLLECKCLTTVEDTDVIQYSDQKYRLCRVIVHVGKSVMNGHYVTYNVKDMCRFNDSPVPNVKAVTDYQLNVAKMTGYIYEYELLER